MSDRLFAPDLATPSESYTEWLDSLAEAKEATQAAIEDHRLPDQRPPLARLVAAPRWLLPAPASVLRDEQRDRQRTNKDTP